MSRMGCICGHIIADHADALPYKGWILKDQDRERISSGLVDALQSYVLAAIAGETTRWLRERGWSEDYLSLGLAHGDVLHDHFFGSIVRVKRDIYQCPMCGRIKIEDTEDNIFSSYSPEEGASRVALAQVTPNPDL